MKKLINLKPENTDSIRKNEIYKIIATKKNYYGDTIVISDRRCSEMKERTLNFWKIKPFKGTQF